MRERWRRRALAGVIVAIGLAASVSSEPGLLVVERQGDRLRLSAPGQHFLEGAPLDQLRNGVPVTFVFSVAVSAEGSIAKRFRLDEAFTVSYDLWEERFAIARTSQPAQPATHLAADAAESWCLNALRVPVSALPTEKTFVIQLDCLVPEAAAGRDDGRSGLTLAALLDLLSRRGRTSAPRWQARSAPLRLADLKDSVR